MSASDNELSLIRPGQIGGVRRHDRAREPFPWIRPAGVLALFVALGGVLAEAGPVTVQHLTCAPGSAMTLTNQAGQGGSYQWFKNGSPVRDSFHIQGGQTSTLQIIDCFPDYPGQVGDEGTYVLTSGAESAQTNAIYVVTLETLTASFTFPPGGVIQLSGNAVGDGLQWYKDGLALADTLDTYRVTGSQTTNLVILSATDADSGSYALECFAGFRVPPITVTNTLFQVQVVYVPPSIPPAIDSFYLLTTGDGVTFTVRASGEQVSYQWYWQGYPIPGATSNILEYANAFLQASAGYYSVVVSNSFGSVSSPPPGLLFTKTIPAGTYQGLFFNADTNAVTLETSGFFQYNVTDAKGAFSGKILQNGKSYPFSGVFLPDQSSQVKKAPGPSLALTLQLVATNDTGQVIGTVTGPGWVSRLYGNRLFYGSQNPFPQAGKFTLSMLNTNVQTLPPTSPNGASFASIVVSSTGIAALSGQVADGTAIAQNCGLSKTGEFPLYVSLLKGRGGIFGWLQITNSGIQGEPIFWIKGAGPDKRYPKGFTNTLQAVGSTYTGPTGSQILQFANGVGAATFTGGDFFSSDGTNTWDFARVTATPPGLYWQPVKYDYESSAPEKVGIDINPGNGVFTGHFVDEMTGLTTPLKGIVLQQQGVGLGYFLSPSASGYLSLEPILQ